MSNKMMMMLKTGPVPIKKSHTMAHNNVVTVLHFKAR